MRFDSSDVLEERVTSLGAPTRFVGVSAEDEVQLRRSLGSRKSRPPTTFGYTLSRDSCFYSF